MQIERCHRCKFMVDADETVSIIHDDKRLWLCYECNRFLGAVDTADPQKFLVGLQIGRKWGLRTSIPILERMKLELAGAMTN